MEKNRKKDMGKIVQFRQNHDFFFSRAMKHLDRDDVEQAAAFAARAVQMDDNNPVYKLELSGIYSQMGRFDESNALLLDLIADGYEDEAECWYGIGCNFAEMQYYNFARDALHRCLELDPDSERAEDAEDILEPIEDYSDGDEHDKTTWFLHHRVLDAEGYYYDGRLELADDILTKIDAIEPMFMNVRNTLAKVKFERGDAQEAARLSNWILSKYPNDTGAMANLAVFAHKTGDEETVRDMTKRMDALKFDRNIEAPEELFDVCFALCEVGAYEEALAKLRVMLLVTPCDRGAMHMSAVCLYRLGRYDDAAAWWRRMLRVDPDDAASEYYLHHTLRVISGRARARKALPTDPVLPNSEYMRRILRVRRMLDDLSAARIKWRSQSEFRALIHWGVAQPELRGALNVFLCMMGDKRAEHILRHELFETPGDEDVKRRACAALKMMDAKEPYYVLTGDALAQVSVEKRKMPEGLEAYAKVLETTLSTMAGRDGENWQDEVTALWAKYTNALDDYPRLRRPEAFSAALEYRYRADAGETVTKSELMHKYGVSLTAFNHALAKLASALAKNREDFDT